MTALVVLVRTASAVPSDASLGKVAFPPEVGKISCADRLFIDDPALQWSERRVIATEGMDGIRRAIDRSDKTKPSMIRVGPGTYRGQCLFIEDRQGSTVATG